MHEVYSEDYLQLILPDYHHGQWKNKLHVSPINNLQTPSQGNNISGEYNGEPKVQLRKEKSGAPMFLLFSRILGPAGRRNYLLVYYSIG